MLQAVITAAQGGHGMPVQALLPLGLWLLSADWGGSIKVWDMASGACVQTLAGAHEEAVMGLLAWEVRIWAEGTPKTLQRPVVRWRDWVDWPLDREGYTYDDHMNQRRPATVALRIWHIIAVKVSS